jgi:hypothetical protein
MYDMFVSGSVLREGCYISWFQCTVLTLYILFFFFFRPGCMRMYGRYCMSRSIGALSLESSIFFSFLHLLVYRGLVLGCSSTYS